MSLISVNNLSFSYDGSYNNIFENVSFNIDTDWKLALIGRNGKGKTTFLKLLQGIYEYKGTISKNVDVDYFPFEVSNKNKAPNINTRISNFKRIKRVIRVEPRNNDPVSPINTSATWQFLRRKASKLPMRAAERSVIEVFNKLSPTNATNTVTTSVTDVASPSIKVNGLMISGK